MSVLSLAAAHAAGKGKESDAVFTVLKEANAAIATLGREKVVNASIGSILDEEEKFVVLPSVDEYFRRLPAVELMNYAPIAGLPEFLEAAIADTFQGNQPPNTYARAVSTPGGTGAVRNTFNNYLEKGQKALIPDWFWGNYRTIAEEHQLGIETYEMFDKEYNFTLNSVKEKTLALLRTQNNLVIVFNTPAHNPTGHSMTKEEWADILGFLKDCAGDESKRIVILVDMAYIDYSGDLKKTRSFMQLFGNLPDNILVTFAYSMSKAYTMYGQRSGALVGLSGSVKIAEEFSEINTFSCRGVWSNGTRGPQRLLADVYKNAELKARIDTERAAYSELMKKRADIFLKEAREVGLKTLPYNTGFFITVPAPEPRAVTQKLVLDNIYALHLKKGVRFAICATPTHKIPGLATKTKEALG